MLVRFSNLPQMGMIVAVWAYDLLTCLEERQKAPCGGAKPAGKQGRAEGFWKRTIRHTAWCLLGYASALGALFAYIHIRYGFGEYAAGIRRLFAMTDKAEDYRPTAMIMGIVSRYREEMYWVIRMGAIVAGGMALFAAAGWLEGKLCAHFQEKG